MFRQFTLALTLVACALAAPAAAQEVYGPYDGIRGGLDSYAYGEAQRREAIDRQLGANEAMRWWREAPGIGLLPSVEYLYIPERRGLFGRRRGGYVVRREYLAPVPYVAPSWGPPARQSIGQVEVQTGPNRWESFPVYPDSRPTGPREF